METNNPNTDIFSSEIRIDDSAKKHLASIAQWAMIVVVTAVIGYVLAIIGFFKSPDTSASSTEGFGNYFIVGRDSAFGVVFGIVVGLLLNYFLYQFARLVKGSMTSMSSEELGESFRNLKIYFIILTIILIIVFLFVLLAMLALA